MQPTPQAPNQNAPQPKQSKWLLPIALVLGLLVAVIYNAHINAVRNSFKTKMIRVAVYQKGLNVGSKLTKKNIGAKLIPAGQFNKQIVKYDEITPYIQDGSKIHNRRSIGDFVTWSDLSGEMQSSPADKIPSNRELVSITIDKASSVGDAITPNSYVSIRGIFKLPGQKRPRSYTILDSVKVVNIDGKGANEISLKKNISRSFKEIGILLPTKVVHQLDNLKTHMRGNFKISLLNPSTGRSKNSTIEINKLLEPLTKYSVEPTRRSSLSGRSNNINYDN